MRTADILAELPKLTKEERTEIRVKIAEMDSHGWLDDAEPLSDADKALLEKRLAAYEKDADAGSSWEDVESRLRARLGK